MIDHVRPSPVADWSHWARRLVGAEYLPPYVSNWYILASRMSATLRIQCWGTGVGNRRARSCCHLGGSTPSTDQPSARQGTNVVGKTWQVVWAALMRVPMRSMEEPTTNSLPDISYRFDVSISLGPAPYRGIGGCWRVGSHVFRRSATSMGSRNPSWKL